jgi:hypothetical protein
VHAGYEVATDPSEDMLDVSNTVVAAALRRRTDELADALQQGPQAISEIVKDTLIEMYAHSFSDALAMHMQDINVFRHDLRLDLSSMPPSFARFAEEVVDLPTVQARVGRICSEATKHDVVCRLREP